MPTHPGGSRLGAAHALIALTVLISAATAASIAHAQSASVSPDRASVSSDPFVRNRFRGSITGGFSDSGTETYLQLGVGIGYYIADGLEIGVNTDLWFIGDPTIVNVTPGLTYVFHMVPTVKPYIGTFYRHAFVFDRKDQDSIGGRAGLYLVPGRVFVGAGIVYEHWLSCSNARYVDCDEVYPEAVVGFTF